MEASEVTEATPTQILRRLHRVHARAGLALAVAADVRRCSANAAVVVRDLALRVLHCCCGGTVHQASLGLSVQSAQL